MNNCRNCGAQVPAEKAWCPQCNEPVEAEARRTVEREMDSFAGTLIRKPKPRTADQIPVPPPVAPTASSPLSAPAPPRYPVTAANPAITAGPMPAVVAPANVSGSPTPGGAEPVKPNRSRLVTLVAIGLILGIILLIVMIAVGIVLWNSSR